MEWSSIGWYCYQSIKDLMSNTVGWSLQTCFIYDWSWYRGASPQLDNWVVQQWLLESCTVKFIGFVIHPPFLFLIDTPYLGYTPYQTHGVLVRTLSGPCWKMPKLSKPHHVLTKFEGNLTISENGSAHPQFVVVSLFVGPEDSGFNTRSKRRSEIFWDIGWVPKPLFGLLNPHFRLYSLLFIPITAIRWFHHVESHQLHWSHPHHFPVPGCTPKVKHSIRSALFLGLWIRRWEAARRVPGPCDGGNKDWVLKKKTTALEKWRYQGSLKLQMYRSHMDVYKG